MIGRSISMLVLLLAMAGCSSGSSPVEEDGGTGTDSGADAGADAGSGAGADAGADAGAGTDAGTDIPPPKPTALDPPLGGDRPARTLLPGQYDSAETWPLVMLLHGYSVSAKIQDIYLRLSPRVSERGFILVLPDGTFDPKGRRFWNAALACCKAPDGPEVDDGAYLRGLIEEAQARLNIDPTRIVLVGHSNGGFMAHALACDAADLVTGILSLAGSVLATEAQCTPARPVSVLNVHGTADKRVGYEGEPVFPGAEALTERWTRYDGCPTVSPVIGEPMDLDVAVEGDETDVRRWSGCAQGTAVELWRMKGSGHLPAFGPGFIDRGLDFLLGHPRQAPASAE